MRGILKSIGYDGTLSVELTEGNPADIEHLIGKDISIDIKQWRDKRSSSANALLWHCIGEITNALRKENRDWQGNKWEVYRDMLRSYGKYTMIAVREDALAAFLESDALCDEVGRKDGYVHLLYYFGSSQYDSKEFAVLLDGCISEMKQMGLPAPTSEEMRRAIAQLEKAEQK